jgi:hypothetical protein
MAEVRKVTIRRRGRGHIQREAWQAIEERAPEIAKAIDAHGWVYVEDDQTSGEYAIVPNEDGTWDSLEVVGRFDLLSLGWAGEIRWKVDSIAGASPRDLAAAYGFALEGTCDEYRRWDDVFGVCGGTVVQGETVEGELQTYCEKCERLVAKFPFTIDWD